MSHCDYCGASTTNGLALCQACRAGLLVYLEYIPVYFRNLSRWRPSAGASDRRSDKALSLIDAMVRVLATGQTRQMGRPSSFTVATSDQIGRALDETHADLTGWLRTLADDRPQLAGVIDRILAMDEEPTVRLACALLTKYVDTLTTLPWVRDIVHGMSEVEQRLRAETERAVPGWYAGACRRCGTATYVVPGLTWVTCGSCGATTHASDHLEVILTEAREWIAPPVRLAEVLVALDEREHSIEDLRKRIATWGARGHLTTIRAHEYAPKRYRLGEVMDRMAAAATEAAS